LDGKGPSCSSARGVYGVQATSSGRGGNVDSKSKKKCIEGYQWGKQTIGDVEFGDEQDQKLCYEESRAGTLVRWLVLMLVEGNESAIPLKGLCFLEDGAHFKYLSCI
jgi:hypothetical protein